jgi:hypothetical protein
MNHHLGQKIIDAIFKIAIVALIGYTFVLLVPVLVWLFVGGCILLVFVCIGMTVYRVFVPDTGEDEPDIPCPKDESDIVGLDNEQWHVEVSPEDAKQ